MNVTFGKTLLLAGACTALGVTYPPAVYASTDHTALQAVLQQKLVSGTIQDAEGPIVGATVMEKGTSNGTITDLDGRFSLNVKPGATLVISYVGYDTQEIAVGNQSTFQVSLESANKSLDEVVVIGYGVQKKN